MSQVLTIGDLIETLIDYRGKTPPKSESGIPLITAKVIKGGTILDEPREYIAEGIYDSWMRRGLPMSGDILVTTEAPLGEVAQVGPDARIALAQRVILLRADAARVDRQFLFHYLRSPQARASLLRRASGTTVSGIRQPELKAVEIPLLPRPQQEIVGQVLDALDGLIDNNRRRVRVLEEMAQAIYREWFVHFRYPGKEEITFVDSSLGPIPDGWSATRLHKIAKVNATSRVPNPDETIQYLDISALGERYVSALNRILGADAPGRARRVVEPGDIVWSMVRPNRRAHALLVRPGADWIASTGLAVITPLRVPSSYLFESVSSRTFGDYLVSRESGAAYPAVKPKDFEDAPILVPTREILNRFDEAVRGMHELAWNLRTDSACLVSLRDGLLPKLVGGQIDVSSLDLDALVEESVA